MTENELSRVIYNQGVRIHTELGPGLLERVYEECLYRELMSKGLSVERQKEVPIKYKGDEIGIGFKADLIVNNKVLIELKSVEEIHPVHLAQTLTYLKMTNLKLGMLINFNVGSFNQGIKRVINGYL